MRNLFLAQGPNFKKRLKRAGIGIVVSSCALVGLNLSPFGKALEQTTLDFRYKNYNRVTRASNRVVVIDVDEQSMKLLDPHLGKWPWPRKIYQELIQFLTSGEPAGIFFDIIFTEKSTTDDGDTKLAEATEQSGIVSHGMLLLEEAATELAPQQERVPLPDTFLSKFAIPLVSSISSQPIYPGSGTIQINAVFKDFLTPNSTVLEKTPRVHVVSTTQDTDGLYRRIPILLPYGNQWLPSLTLKAILSTLKEPRVSISTQEVSRISDSFELLIQGKSSDGTERRLTIPLEADGNYRMHFYKAVPGFEPEKIPFASVISSAAKLMSGEFQDFSKLQVNPLDLKDKIIIVGGSAAGLSDLKSTPTNRAYPGVMLHATAIANILSQDFLTALPRTAQLAINLLTLLLVYFSIYFLESMLLKIIIPTVWMLTYTFLAFLFFRNDNIWMELASPLLLGLGGTLDAMSYLIFVENKDKKKLKDTLSKYLPPSVTDQIIASGLDPQAEVGTKRELSILFSDIRGFTSLSEVLRPEQLVQMLNQYLGKMTALVFDYTGTLDKFIGDAVMAFWGAPIPSAEHAKHSVICALKMVEALDELNIEWEKTGTPQLKIGIGINTGEVIVGNIGSEKRLDYTVIGDNVNLASRLESLTKQYGVSILISEKTAQLAGNSIIYRSIDSVKVKGKKRHVKILQVLCFSSAPTAKLYLGLSERFEIARQLYEEGKFEMALNRFKETDEFWRSSSLDSEGDLTSQIFIERCQELLKNPPQAWDGIFTAESK